MNILGLNYYFHDSTACVVMDGKLVVAIEEERLTRNKHTTEFPLKSIDRCLSIAGLTPRDIDAVAVSIKPTKDWATKVKFAATHRKSARHLMIHELGGGLYRQNQFKGWYRATWPSDGPPIHFVPHHTAHAAGTFLVSPWDNAAIISIDGSGEWATSFLGEGRGTQVRRFSESFFPDSLGLYYEAATKFCGFIPNYDEGKTMGLAPFGDPEVFGDTVRDIVRVDDEGLISLDTSYFGFHGADRVSPRFVSTFGPPRTGNEFADHHKDVAAAFQMVLEERALEMCAVLRRKTKCRYLIIAGGVALNSVMNGRILEEAGFDDIYVMPAAGDNGTAIGAAMYVHNVVHSQPRTYVHEDPYVGTSYSNERIERLLKESKLDYERHEDIASVTAGMVADGQIVGWYQGRMEIGPRALGNRTILANPMLADMKDKVNAEVKHREAFRPFAPSCVVEEKDKYFDVIGDSPFMLKVCPVRPEMRDVIPAITHVDGTARLQTVRKDINPAYHDVISKFGAITGVPVVLNTSFNIMGEPIVESPEDAVRCYSSTGLDALAIGDYLVKKR